MKRLLFCICLLGGFREAVTAQQDRFLFIQHSSRQPFYVRIGPNSYPSSGVGHLTLAPLADSMYTVFIGFPESRYPEQLFPVDMRGTNRGFELKNEQGKWLLDDLLSDSVITVSGINDEGLSAGDKKDDSYSRLMAGVVNDTAVLYTTVKPEPSADSSVKGATPGKVKRRPVAGDTTLVARPPQPVNGVYLDKRDIIRYSTENIEGGKLMIYLDRSQLSVDTIRIIIPRL